METICCTVGLNIPSVDAWPYPSSEPPEGPCWLLPATRPRLSLVLNFPGHRGFWGSSRKVPAGFRLPNWSWNQSRIRPLQDSSRSGILSQDAISAVWAGQEPARTIGPCPVLTTKAGIPGISLYRRPAIPGQVSGSALSRPARQRLQGDTCGVRAPVIPPESLEPDESQTPFQTTGQLPAAESPGGISRLAAPPRACRRRPIQMEERPPEDRSSSRGPEKPCCRW